MTTADVRMRAETARKYVDVAELVADEPAPADRQVAAGVAVLAAVAAADAICGAVLKQAAQGQDHGQAADLLATIRPGGDKLATSLRRCLAEKTNAQYGTTHLSASTAQQVLQHAKTLVEAIPTYVR